MAIYATVLAMWLAREHTRSVAMIKLENVEHCGDEPEQAATMATCE